MPSPFLGSFQLILVILVLLPVMIIPINRAEEVYHLSYTDVLYNLVVHQRFGPAPKARGSEDTRGARVQMQARGLKLSSDEE